MITQLQIDYKFITIKLSTDDAKLCHAVPDNIV